LKISPVTQYKPNFGYDKRLNKSLKYALSKHDDRVMAETISSLNDYCNLVEDNLRTEEKAAGSGSSRYQDLQDILVTSKQMLAGFASITFPKLHYADREYKHYNVEFVKRGSKDSDWRGDLIEAISEWTENTSSKDKQKTDPSKQIYKPKFDEDGVEITEEEQKKNLVDKISKAISGKNEENSLLEKFKPSAQSPKGFADVAGMEKLKRDLKNGIIQFINDPQQAQKDLEEYGKAIPKSLLLYGPPGCGKTYITQALASEIDTPMYMLNISKAGSEYINQTSKNLKQAFDAAAKISEEQQKPCLLFMDEIDSLAFNRGNMTWPEDIKQVATMLQCIDGAKQSNVLIIGATNKYDILDPAIRRRFDSKVFVDLPDKEAIQSLLVKQLTPMSKAKTLLSSDEDMKTIAGKLSGFSNSSICIITKEAALNALARDRADIAVEDFEKAIKETGEEKPNRKEYLSETKKENKKIGFVK
jgi:SpoVK/Ycf46/Vps4 family AAA+-type ATPase